MKRNLPALVKLEKELITPNVFLTQCFAKNSKKYKSLELLKTLKDKNKLFQKIITFSISSTQIRIIEKYLKEFQEEIHLIEINKSINRDAFIKQSIESYNKVISVWQLFTQKSYKEQYNNVIKELELLEDIISNNHINFIKNLQSFKTLELLRESKTELNSLQKLSEINSHSELSLFFQKINTFEFAELDARNNIVLLTFLIEYQKTITNTLNKLSKKKYIIQNNVIVEKEALKREVKSFGCEKYKHLLSKYYKGLIFNKMINEGKTSKEMFIGILSSENINYEYNAEDKIHWIGHQYKFIIFFDKLRELYCEHIKDINLERSNRFLIKGKPLKANNLNSTRNNKVSKMNNSQKENTFNSLTEIA